MNPLIRLGGWIKKALTLAITVACVVAIFWGILYKFLLPFTPLWLDEVTVAAGLLALLVAWLIGKSGTGQDAEEKDAKPVPAVPDAAAQLSQEEGPLPPAG